MCSPYFECLTGAHALAILAEERIEGRCRDLQRAIFGRHVCVLRLHRCVFRDAGSRYSVRAVTTPRATGSLRRVVAAFATAILDLGDEEDAIRLTDAAVGGHERP